MAAAVLPIRLDQRMNTKANISSPAASASSSRLAEAFASSKLVPDSSGKPFRRIRTSLEHTLRTATRSRNKPPVPAADDFDTVKAKPTDKGKEKERSSGEELPKGHKERERSKVLQKLEATVGFRSSGRESSPSPIPPPIVGKTKDGGGKDMKNKDESQRVAGYTNFTTPSLRGASISSPALHLHSQAIPSPKSQSAVPATSSSTVSILASPTRDGTRRSSMQAPVIGGPVPLSSRRDPRSSPTAKTPSKRPPLNSPSSPSLSRARSPSPRRGHDRPRTPDSPTPNSSARQYKNGNNINGFLNTPPASPTLPTARTKSPTMRGRGVAPSQRGLTSASASNLSMNGTTSPDPPSNARRSSPDTARRPPADTTRRSSIDAPRRPSGEHTRPPYPPITPVPVSPTSPVRPRTSPHRANSPSYAHNRYFNISTASIVPASTPEQREIIRSATSILCRELRKMPAHMAVREWEEVEVRLQPLVRLERIWGKSGSVFGGSASQIQNGSGAGGEERERRVFCEALRDGFVLCHLMNKLRPSTIARVDSRDDGFKRTSNVTKFLSSCSSQGVNADELFYKDDLIEATPESLARVAETIISVVKVVETPLVDRSKIITGQSKKSSTDGSGVYSQGTFSRAAASVPNLSTAQRSTSPTSPSPAPGGRKRWSPPSPPLATVRSASPSELGSGTDSSRTSPQTQKSRPPPVLIPARDDAPPTLTPRSPLRPQRDGDVFGRKSQSAEPMMRGESHSPSAESPGRQSMVSSTTTDMSAYSSLLDSRNGYNQFGTMRTVTTEATSYGIPSFSRTEGSFVAASLSVAEDIARKRGKEPGRRERKPSEAAGADLAGVAEERPEDMASRPAPKDASVDKMDGQARVHLGKGIWPDDFLDVFQQGRTRPIPIKPSNRDVQDSSPARSSPISVSPPRKLAYVGVSRRNESLDSLPRRPTHRTAKSIDTAALAPKESVLRRDISPEGISASNGRGVVLRRQSTKAAASRNGTYIPRSDVDDPRSSNEGVEPLVPFPSSVCSDRPPSSEAPTDDNDKPRQPRGRFQSDIEGLSSKMRDRPESYDEMGNKKPRRTRFESMVNLGIVSSNASASDLLSRDSIDGSTVRQTLIVREAGKSPTHFQLGNCIGRGQFGSVYRALNLNTGQMVAVKRIRLEGLKEEEVMQLMKEVDLVKSLSHPSIVKYEGMARDDDTLSIVLEYVENGSLGQTLKAFGKLNESLVASYVVKILEGLHYLHESDVVHCDLKAANILTTKNGNVKLSDFGVSLNLRAMEREMKDVAGTPNWMAPEVIELKGASTKSDIWSLGATVIELLTGRPPYADIANGMSVMFRIVEDDMPPLPECASPMLEDFLKQCFNKDPTLRPSAELLCEHEWLKKSWSGLKDLRPQDSIPFLRRVSTDFQKSEALQFLSQIDIPTRNSPAEDDNPRHDIFIGTPPQAIPRRFSHEPTSPLGTPDDSMSPHDHSFVKTTFSKPMVCRVCLLNVKKSAVLCESCSLIAHSKCATNAPPTCDLRAQLLMYAQYAEKGNPGSAYANSVDILKTGGGHIPTSPTSEVAYVAPPPSSNISTENSTAAGSPNRPHTAFKFMGGAFKTKPSRTSLSPEPSPDQGSSSTSLLPLGSDMQSQSDVQEKRAPRPRPKEKERTILRKASVIWRGRETRQQRPHSISSTSTTPNTASMRSAVDSLSSKLELPTKSGAPANETDLSAGGMNRTRPSVPDAKALHTPSLSVTSSVPAREEDYDYPSDIPGGLPADERRHKKKDSGNCAIQ